MNYPGDNAEPEAVAKWMSEVAETGYGLPGILPVMTSYVEITDAWTGPGDVKTVTGYLWPVDGCSVGYFQQQADDLGCGMFGWGSRAQCIDADYALRAFCREAEKYKGQFADTPAGLGSWCQKVQRSAYGERYASKGYLGALELLEDAQEGTEWPERMIGISIDGWAFDYETDAWLKSQPGTEFKTNADGWVYRTGVVLPEPEKKWEWPVANTPPTSGNYVARHPTRYTWRADVEKWARYLVNTEDLWCNTYYDHPEGYWRTEDSMDVWGPGGRGDPIDTALGDRIFSMLFNDPDEPDIEWIIWQATIYGAWNNWYGEPFGEDDFSWHYDHIHVTYL